MNHEETRRALCERIAGRRILSIFPTDHPDVVGCRMAGGRRGVKYVNTRTKQLVLPPAPVKKVMFRVFEHQSKERLFVEALKGAGFAETLDDNEADFFLTDLDIGGRHKKFSRYMKNNEKLRIFLYPHAARPAIWWDGWYKQFEETTANFVATEGHAEIMRLAGYTLPIHPVGWAYSEVLPFRSPRYVENVLFMPTHPNTNGYLPELQKKVNAAAFARLLKLAKRGAIRLTVRYLIGLPQNGIGDEQQGVRYIKGKPDQSTVEIDEADVVVANQTSGYLAVARGKPTVMMGEGETPVSGNCDANVKYVQSWEKYKHLMMFPLDILDAFDPLRMLQQAAKRESAEVADWKRRMIGGPFDADLFVRIVKGYL